MLSQCVLLRRACSTGLLLCSGGTFSNDFVENVRRICQLVAQWACQSIPTKIMKSFFDRNIMHFPRLNENDRIWQMLWRLFCSRKLEDCGCRIGYAIVSEQGVLCENFNLCARQKANLELFFKINLDFGTVLHTILHYMRSKLKDRVFNETGCTGKSVFCQKQYIVLLRECPCVRLLSLCL